MCILTSERIHKKGYATDTPSSDCEPAAVSGSAPSPFPQKVIIIATFLTCVCPQFLLAQDLPVNPPPPSVFDKTSGESIATLAAVLMALMALRLHGSKRQVEKDLKLAEAVVERTRDLEREKGQAEEATHLKSEFLASVGLEINTPAKSLLNLLGGLLNTKLTSGQRQTIEKSMKSVESLQTLAADIAEFAKEEAKYMAVEQVMFSMNHSVHGAISTVSARAAESGIALSTEIDVEVPDLLVGDPERLRQLIIRLFDQALKETSGGKMLFSVRSERREGIGDSGSESSRTLLFSLYNTLPPLGQRLEDGAPKNSDLAMTICGRLVRMIGGRMWWDQDEHGSNRYFFTAKFQVPSSKQDLLGVNRMPLFDKFAIRSFGGD